MCRMKMKIPIDNFVLWNFKNLKMNKLKFECLYYKYMHLYQSYTTLKKIKIFAH